MRRLEGELERIRVELLALSVNQESEASELMTDLKRRGRVGDLWLRWKEGGAEKPELTHPRDLYWWAHMEEIGEIYDQMVEEGLFDGEVEEDSS